MIIRNDHKKKYLKNTDETFRSVMLTILPITTIFYVGHYYFFDMPMNLTPQKLWFNYRFGVAGLCVFGFIFYYFKKTTKHIPYKTFAFIISFLICFLQTKTIIWYPKVPYFYSFLFLIITSFALRLTPFATVAYIVSAFAVQNSTFKDAGVHQSELYSDLFVSLLFGFILSIITYFQTKVFITNENLFDIQKKNIEQNIEFTQLLKSFLPKEISRRIDKLISTKKYSIQQAFDDVLRPRNKIITCLSCDIRNYTQKTKDDMEFVLNSVIPLTKKESFIVEQYSGIPRKIGDMLFCYFDSDNFVNNIINASISAISIVSNEIHVNKRKSIVQKVKKQILLTTGEAYVGNIGGQDSGIEITALGTPVNFLSRLEDVVKQPKVIKQIPRNHIIISKEFKVLLDSITNQNILFKKYEINKFNLKIKDFEEINTFYTFEASVATENMLLNSMNDTKNIYKETA